MLREFLFSSTNKWSHSVATSNERASAEQVQEREEGEQAEAVTQTGVKVDSLLFVNTHQTHKQLACKFTKNINR
jgi:hypothetical protein